MREVVVADHVLRVVAGRALKRGVYAQAPKLLAPAFLVVQVEHALLVRLQRYFPPVHVFTFTVSAAWASPESSADAPNAAVTAIKAATSSAVACFMDVRPPSRYRIGLF
jgi:hypothetical protein